MEMLYEIIIHNLTKTQAKTIISGLKNKDKYYPEMKPQVLRAG